MNSVSNVHVLHIQFCRLLSSFAVVTDLRPNTVYEFYVQSFGVRGDGPSSPVLAVRTRVTAPSQPPANLRVVEAMMDDILVAWDEPPADASCVIRGYR